MRHMKAINQKARRMEQALEGARAEGHEVVALETPNEPDIPLGCTLIFDPGWETGADGTTAGLCQPIERDLFDCHLGCFWPAQVPDQLNAAPDWTSKCAAAQKDWRKIDVIFP